MTQSGPAVDAVDHAGRKARRFQQLERDVHRERAAFGRFYDHGIAGRHCVGQEPERDHPGKIEGRDDGRHADRLADHQLVNARRDVFGDGALHQGRNTARDFHVFDSALHLAFGLAERLAVLVGDRARQLVDVLFEQPFELEQVLHALNGRDAPPGIRRRDGSFSRLIDYGWRRQRDFGDRFAGSRVDDGLIIVRRRFLPCAVNVIG